MGREAPDVVVRNDDTLDRATGFVSSPTEIRSCVQKTRLERSAREETQDLISICEHICETETPGELPRVLEWTGPLRRTVECLSIVGNVTVLSQVPLKL
ncbi:hypothetical protein DPEC_G00100610 [Dallia pectoralis]|uniref:Uncharacterized protein n=1 Tax=Dallia pectoralis TaxID=75939 RepID=A0ACC2GWA1_DALPE|nr:hypothetical protein DPEC_G00100610 [Dallia pectoralis]